MFIHPYGMFTQKDIHPYVIFPHIVLSSIQDIHRYWMYTHMGSSPIWDNHPYRMLTYMGCSPIQDVRPYGRFTHTGRLPIWVVHPYGIFTHPCEILGSYLQQHHQHPIFRAHFHAEPQGKAQTKKEDGLYIPNSKSELTVSGLTDITASLWHSI